jgi:RHS repeat-associated protein
VEPVLPHPRSLAPAKESCEHRPQYVGGTSKIRRAAAGLLALTSVLIGVFVAPTTARASSSPPSPPPLVRAGTPSGSALPAEAPQVSGDAECCSYFLSVASPSASSSVAVGTYDYDGSYQALVNVVSNGIWTPVNVPLPGTGLSSDSELDSVVCPAPGTCTAVGYYDDSSGNQQGLILSLSGGVWTATKAPIPTGGTDVNPTVTLTDVSCASTTFCVAVGTYPDSRGDMYPLLETLSSGSWTPTKGPVPSNAYMDPEASQWAVSCPSAGFCVSAGSYYTGTSFVGLLETLSSGVWTDTAMGATASLGAVYCESSTFCLALGSGNILETLAGGSWSASTPPLPANANATPNAYLVNVTCTSSSSCILIGGYTDSSSASQGFFDTLSSGTWSSVEAPLPTGATAFTGFYGISCASTGSCAVVGRFDNPQAQGLLDTLSSGAWTAIKTPVPANAFVSPTESYGTPRPIVCSAVGACVAAGFYFTQGGGYSGLIDTYAGGVWTATVASEPTIPPLGSDPSNAELAGGGINATEACSGSGALQGNATSDPVDTESGNFWHTFTDIAIPGRSCPLGITRTYNSQNASVNGPFGYGWNYNYGMSLVVTGTSPNEVATITQENGSQVTYNQPASGNIWTPSAPRFIATLTANTGGTWTFVRQAKDTYNFNSSGQLTSIVDLNGYTTTLSYTSGKLATVTDPASRTLTIGWTGSNITSVTDSNVSGNTRTVTYEYNDGNGNLTDVIDVNGGHTQFAYTSHELTTMYDPNCYAANQAHSGTCPGVINDYNTNGTVAWQKDQLGRETSFTYTGTPGTAAGGATTTTDPKGNETLEQYQYGLRITATHGYETSSAATTYYSYDPTTLAVISITDPNGDLTTNTVDANGNVLTSLDPLGHTTTNTYNSFNEVLTAEDGNGITTTNTFDTHGNLTSTSRPVTGTSCTCQVTTYNHANATYPGDVTSIVDPDSQTTSFGYDAYGNKVETKDPLGHVSGSVFNADGWITASYTPKAGCTWGSTPPTGCSSTYETQYSYVIPGGSTVDKFGDVGTITDPLGHTEKYTYDLDRNTLTSTDGDGNVTTNAYDAANELCWTLPGGTSSSTCASPPANARVTDYNPDGSVADQKDGKGNKIISYGYDPLARVTSTTDALSHVTNYTLDGDGNILAEQGPGGSCTGTLSNCTTNTYDADNNPKTVSYSDNSSENITSTTYDEDNQLKAMTDGTGSSSWVFDNLHRVTSYENGNGVTVGYTYNLDNSPLTVVYPGTSHTATYSYDNDNRMHSLEDWLSTTSSIFGYDANSNLTTDTLRNGVTDTYGFNAADQMSSISDKDGSTTIFAATYTRDSNGQLATDSSQATNQEDYKYTPLNQLCYAGSANTAACTSPPASSYPYAYDSAGNLTTMENAGHTASNTQQFNNADELCWTVPGASSNACGTVPTGATTFGYNNNGDRTSTVPSTGSATCDTYDDANRLTEIQTGTGSTCTTPTTVGTYKYDGEGMRQSKTVGSTTTQYLYDGRGGNLLQEKAGSGNPTLYLYGPNNLPVEQINNTTAYFYAHDQIGSTRALSTGTGTQSATFSYDPYGNVVACTNATVTIAGSNKCTGTSIGVVSLLYTGQYRDNESNLYYLRSRYYDSTTGNLLTTDPAVSLTHAPYAYVLGNPLNTIDPTGRWQCANSSATTCSLPSTVDTENAASLTACLASEESPVTMVNGEPVELISESSNANGMEQQWLRYTLGTEDAGLGIAAVVGGGVLVYAGVVLAPETDFLSLVLVPAGIGMSAGGGSLAAVGGTELFG